MTPERPSDPSLREILVRGERVSLTDESAASGDGPILVALHGLPGGARDWRWLAPALVGVRFIRLELPGFGGTPRAAMPEAGFEARARWVLDVMTALGIERFAVMGHSIGGPLAMAVAGLAPERVSGLALVASVGLSEHVGYRRARPMRRLAPLIAVPGLSRVMRPVLRKAFERFGFRGHPDEALIHTLRVVAVLDFQRNRGFAGRVTAPTLVAWTDDDPIVEARVGEELAALLPGGPRLHFESGGHNLQKSRAVELGAALSDWLASLR